MSKGPAEYDQKATKSGIVYITINILMRAGNLLLVPIYTIFLTSEGFGYFALFVALATLWTPFLSLAGDAVITRYYFVGEEKIGGRKLYLSTIGAILLINSIIVGALLYYYDESVLSLLERLGVQVQYRHLALATALALVWIKAYQRVLKASQDLKITPTLNLLRFVMQVGLTLPLLVFTDLHEMSMIYGFLVAAVTVGIISVISYLRAYPPRLNAGGTIDLIKFTVPLIPNRFAAFAVQPVQTFMIAGIGSTGMLGIFYVASMFGSAFTLLSQNLSEAMQPWLFQKYSLENWRENIQIPRAVYVTVLLVLSCTVLAAGFGIPIIPLILGTEFESVAGYFTVFLVFSFSNFVKNFAVSVLMYFPGGAKFIAIGTYANIGLMLLLTWLTLETFGLWGAVWSLAIARYVSSEITIYFACKYSGDSIPFSQMRVMTIGLATFVAAAYQTSHISVWLSPALSVFVLFLLFTTNRDAFFSGYGLIKDNSASFFKKRTKS